LPEFRHVTELAEPKIVVAFRTIHDRDYADELAALVADYPSVERLVILEGELADGATAEDFLAAGDTIDDAHLARARDGVAIDDTAIIIFTSGTTGRPKGAMVRHRAPVSTTAGSPATRPRACWSPPHACRRP